MADLADLLGEALHGIEPSPAALERTIQRIRRRQRRRRALAAGVTVALLVALGTGAWMALDGGRGGGPPGDRAAAPATPTPSSAEAPGTSTRAVFKPPVRRDGGRWVMPLTFPDGSAAELVYPPDLDLAAMGVQPDLSFRWPNQTGTRFPLTFWFGQPDAGLFEGDQPVARYTTPRGGQAELWRARAGSVSTSTQRYWLAFQRTSWTVLAPVATPAMAAEIARGLDARETGDGYVVMEAVHPLALAREPGEGGGPQLAVGDRNPRPREVDAGTRFRLITLRPSRSCRPAAISPSGQSAAACLGTAGAGGSVFAGIDGDRPFVEAVLAGLEARNVRIAS
jgi:hypothetical protein